MPVLSDPVTMFTEALQYPSVEFFDYEDSTSEIPQPSGQPLDARDERLRQVAFSNGFLWTCTAPSPFPVQHRHAAWHWNRVCTYVAGSMLGLWCALLAYLPGDAGRI